MQRVTWLGVQRVAWASSPLVAPLAAKPQSASSTSSVRSGSERAGEAGVVMAVSFAETIGLSSWVWA
nr:MAG TPA: hypothetical protein [Caudoviricetes sp.]